MRHTFHSLNLGVFRSPIAAAMLASLSLALAAQAPPSTEAQHEAMQKLAFLVGRWSGPITVVRGPGEPLKAVQSEDVQFKLDGLVLLVEGKSTNPDGKVSFSALATISYDDASKTYRVRAYHEGRYVDTELAVAGDGFSWGFPAGPAHVVNTMRLTGKGKWQESTEVDMGSGPPRKVVDMLLNRQP
jgi:hypothetical protein